MKSSINYLLFALVLISIPVSYGSAHAGIDRIGAGVEVLSSIVNNTTPQLAADIDLGQFQIVPAFGLIHRDINGANSGSQTGFLLSGRFWFNLAKHERADLAVGGGIGFSVTSRSFDNTNIDSDTNVDTILDGGARIRLFFTNNVALSFTGGLSLTVGDGPTTFALGNHLIGSGGLYYYF